MSDLERWLDANDLANFFETLDAEQINLTDLPALTDADAAADELLQAALVQADALGMRPLSAHCHRALGSRSDSSDARHHADTATSIYRSLGMQRFIARD